MLGAWTGLWLFACGRLEQGLREAAAGAAADGWRVRYGAARHSGWPTTAELVVASVTAEASAAVFPPELAWTAARLRLRLGVTRPGSVLVYAEGRQTVGANGVEPIPFEAREFLVAAPLAGADPATASVSQLVATLPAGPLRIASGQLTFPPNGLTAELHGVAVPDGRGGTFAPSIDSLELRAQSSEAIPRRSTPAESARAWRDAGGTVEISTLSLRWGPLTANGRVVVTLDDALQPEAEGTIEASGLSGLLDTLAGSGLVTPGAATAAKAVAAVLAGPTGAAPIRLPVQLRAGVLSVARFPLLRLEPLVWE